MDEADFRREAARQGYSEFSVRDWAAGTVNDRHTHEFSAMVLILDGELTVDTPQGTRTCRRGDINSVAAGVVHSEQVGPEGVRFLSARK